MAQTQNQTFNFVGTMTALEPLTVTQPGVRGLPRNGRGKDANAYWPATTIRGSLRHCAHRVALSKTRKPDGSSPFNLDAHFLLAQGVDISAGKSQTAAVAEDTQAVDSHLRLDVLDNPLLSLFGFWGKESKLAVGSAYPDGQAIGYFGGGARGVMFERETSLIEELTLEDQERLETLLAEQTAAADEMRPIDEEIRGLKSSLKAAESDAQRKQVREQIAELEARKEAIKDAKKESRESIRRPIDQYEGIVPGTEMEHRMTLKSACRLELGFFLAVLAEFARDSRMGGHIHHGCGLVKASYEVRVWPEGELLPKVIGSVGVSPDGFSVEGAELQAALKEWAESAPTFSCKVAA